MFCFEFLAERLSAQAADLNLEPPKTAQEYARYLALLRMGGVL